MLPIHLCCLVILKVLSSLERPLLHWHWLAPSACTNEVVNTFDPTLTYHYQSSHWNSLKLFTSWRSWFDSRGNPATNPCSAFHFLHVTDDSSIRMFCNDSIQDQEYKNILITPMMNCCPWISVLCLDVASAWSDWEDGKGQVWRQFEHISSIFGMTLPGHFTLILSWKPCSVYARKPLCLLNIYCGYHWSLIRYLIWLNFLFI